MLPAVAHRSYVAYIKANLQEDADGLTARLADTPTVLRLSFACAPSRMRRCSLKARVRAMQTVRFEFRPRCLRMQRCRKLLGPRANNVVVFHFKDVRQSQLVAVKQTKRKYSKREAKKGDTKAESGLETDADKQTKRKYTKRQSKKGDKNADAVESDGEEENILLSFRDVPQRTLTPIRGVNDLF